jgi:hypothetical protein
VRGLLHQRVLAGCEGDPGAVEVGGVLGGGVDDVDVRRGCQLLVGAVRVRDAMAARARDFAGAVTRSDGREDLPGVALHGGDEALGDPAGAQNTPAQYGRFHRGRSARGGKGGGEGGHAQTSGTWTATVRPPFFMDVMTASATALATRPSSAVASGEGVPEATASAQAWSSRR